MRRTRQELLRDGIITTGELWARDTGIMRGMISKERGWIRLFGRGIGWRSDMFGLEFSERNGLKRVLHIGPWYIWWLPV